MPATSVKATTRTWLTTRPDAPTKPNRSQPRARSRLSGDRSTSGKDPCLVCASMARALSLPCGAVPAPGCSVGGSVRPLCAPLRPGWARPPTNLFPAQSEHDREGLEHDSPTHLRHPDAAVGERDRDLNHPRPRAAGSIGHLDLEHVAAGADRPARYRGKGFRAPSLEATCQIVGPQA